MKRISSMGSYYRIETFDLTEEQHDLAVEMIRNGKKESGKSSLQEADKEMANVWIADAHSEGNEEYAEFLREALAVDADLYTFKEGWQEIGEVAVYDCIVGK